MKSLTRGALVYMLSCSDIQSAIVTRERIGNTVYCHACGARMFIVGVIYSDYAASLQVYPFVPEMPYERAL
jgi:hypothetical protein